MSEQENSQIVQKAYESFNAGDVEGVMRALAADVDWVLSPMPNVSFYTTRRGQDGVRAYFADLAEHQEAKGAVEVHGTIAQGNTVVVHGHYAWHVKSTGRDFGADFAHIWTMDGGKTTRFQEYTDSAAFAGAYA